MYGMYGGEELRYCFAKADELKGSINSVTGLLTVAEDCPPGRYDDAIHVVAYIPSGRNTPTVYADVVVVAESP